jgi:hypothetical protein
LTDRGEEPFRPTSLLYHTLRHLASFVYVLQDGQLDLTSPFTLPRFRGSSASF